MKLQVYINGYLDWKTEEDDKGKGGRWEKHNRIKWWDVVIIAKSIGAPKSNVNKSVMIKVFKSAKIINKSF